MNAKRRNHCHFLFYSLCKFRKINNDVMELRSFVCGRKKKKNSMFLLFALQYKYEFYFSLSSIAISNLTLNRFLCIKWYFFN